MKILNKLCFMAISIVILFTACEKENIDEIIPQDPVYEIDTIDVNPLLSQMVSQSSVFLEISCVSIPYPVEFLQASGNTITVSSPAELDDALMLSDSIVDFIYPFEATVESGTIIIESIEDLATAITFCSTTTPECADLRPHVLLFFNSLNIFTLNRYPYDVNYPVTLIVEGNEVVINSGDEYLPAVTVDGSPNNLLETELVYPITITQFGQQIVLNNDNDVCEFYDTINLSEPCENKPAHIQFFFNEGPGTPINCTYFINYPVDIVLNGETVTIPTREDYLSELNASPTAYDNIQIVYPVDVFKFEGPDVVFESDADICQYLDNCQ